jgi:hypothetical protein
VSIREVTEGRLILGEDEKQKFSITTTPWGTGPSSISVVIKDVTADWQDVTASKMTGSPTLSGDVITTPLVHSLVRNHLYRVEVKFDAQGNTFEPYFEIDCER